jgi:hypothetical protein
MSNEKTLFLPYPCFILLVTRIEHREIAGMRGASLLDNCSALANKRDGFDCDRSVAQESLQSKAREFLKKAWCF